MKILACTKQILLKIPGKHFFLFFQILSISLKIPSDFLTFFRFGSFQILADCFRFIQFFLHFSRFSQILSDCQIYLDSSRFLEILSDPLWFFLIISDSQIFLDSLRFFQILSDVFRSFPFFKISTFGFFWITSDYSGAFGLFHLLSNFWILFRSF